MDRMMRLETNSVAVSDYLARLFEPYPGPLSSQPEFLWRIVIETQAGLKPPWPGMRAFSGQSLRYVNLGQRSFFAVDLEAREAIAFLPEELAKDEPGFSSVFLATLFDMTAGALGLIQISAACVAHAGKGLLIFGPPRSGKTTSAYLAGKAGLEFHADQAAFIEAGNGGIRAWGQFWPAAFRTETAEFLPEITASTLSFTYEALTFLCLEKRPFQPSEARSVTPVSCVFLKRNARQGPRLIRMPSSDLRARLRESLPFEDDARFEPERNAILRTLGDLPAYRLPYGSDPAEAAGLYRGLLKRHDLGEDGL